MRTIPTTRTGQTRLTILKEKPADRIQAVSVVPIFAPIITDMACVKVSRAAFTKDTVITVVADEDWTATVIRAPVATPEKRFPVIAPNK